MFERMFFRKVLLSICLVIAAPAAARAVGFEELDNATPGDQYRRLSLMLLISTGTEAEFLSLMQTFGEPGPGDMQLAIDDYLTPLVRIVDQETMLANANTMIRFTRAHQQEIGERMKALAAAHPILVSMVDVNEITADAIIIRNSLADSLDYMDYPNDAAAAEIVQRFRDQTVRLRNMMEYNQFQAELARITDQAITDLGGRLDAYQRMFDEEVDPDLVKRRIESAEIMNEQVDDRFEEQANARNAELLMMLILMESQVKR